METNSEKLKKHCGVLVVPVEVIPCDLSIEKFVEGWKNQDPKVMQIVNTKCTLIEDYIENKDKKNMKEVWLTKGSPKWMPFHLIFFKNADWLLLPCVSFVKKNKAQCLGSEIIFGILKWRMSIYFHNGNK